MRKGKELLKVLMAETLQEALAVPYQGRESEGKLAGDMLDSLATMLIRTILSATAEVASAREEEPRDTIPPGVVVRLVLEETIQHSLVPLLTNMIKDKLAELPADCTVAVADYLEPHNPSDN